MTQNGYVPGAEPSNASGLLKKALDKAVIIAYIALMAVNFLGELAGLPRMLKLAGVVVVGYAVLRFLIVFDTDNVRYIGEYFAIIAIPIVLVLTVSLVLWLNQLEPMSGIMDASQRLLVQFINIFLAVAAIYLFRGAAMRYTLYGMSIAYCYIIFRAVARFGVAGFISSLTRFALSLGVIASGAMAQLEVHDMTFAFGFFMVYYFVAAKGEPRRRLCQILSTVCFILGYKRSAMLGVVIALAFNFFLSRVRKEEKKKTLLLMCTGLFLFCYAYLLFTKYDLFTMMMDRLGINTMGRSRLYTFINQYYEFSPAFPGYGFNYVRTFMYRLRDTGLSEFSTGAIHNEIVRQYIEMGFWGFFLWLSYELLIRPRWMLRRHGLFSSKVYLLCSIYIFTTYLTDNTMFYYHTAFIYRLIPLVCAQMYHDAGDRQVRAVLKGAPKGTLYEQEK